MHIISKVTFFLFIFLPGALANYHPCPNLCQCFADPIEHSRAIHLICKWEQVNTTNLETLSKPYAVRTLTIRCPHHGRLRSSPSPRLFANLRNLDRLEIDRCKMIELPERLFEGLSQLYSLIIKRADLEVISPAVFQPLSNLMALDLTGNKLLAEPPALASLPNLIQLDMSNNSIPYLASALKNLHRLKILSMDYNIVTSIDFRRFPPSLTDLSLRSNQIDTVHFINDSVPQLRRLDLAGNEIEQISASGTVNVFPHSVRLLDISYNRIKHIADGAFGHLEKLIMIDMRYNFMTQLHESTVRANSGKHKRQIFVAGNPLMCTCSIRWMIHPESKESPVVMDVGNTTCTSPVHANETIPLNEADISQRLLCKYQSECLPGCTCCMAPLGLCPCQSTCPPGCTCWHSAASTIRKPGQNVVKCHRVRVDRVTPIPEMATELHFPDVRMDAIGIDTIGTRNRVVLLNISNSRLNGITHETLMQFPRLQTLDLTDTNIETLPHNALRSSTDLTTLYLHNNKLHNLDLSLLSSMSRLSHLTLSGDANQFTCSCTAPSDMQVWLLNEQNRKRVIDYDEIRCKFEETTSMVFIYEMDPWFNETLCPSMSTPSTTVPVTTTSSTTSTERLTTEIRTQAALSTTEMSHSSEPTLETPSAEHFLITRQRTSTTALATTRTPRTRATTRDPRSSSRNANVHAFMTIVIFLLLLTVVCLLFAIGSTVYYRFIRQPQSYIQKGNSAPRADEEVPLNL